MIEQLSKMTNKKFIFTCLDLLKESGQLTDKRVNLLLDRDYCSNKFLCRFSVLTEVPIEGEVAEEYYNDSSGRRRYYPNKYIINDKAFIVTNHWYGPGKSNPDNRTPFIEWINKSTNLKLLGI